VVALLSCVCEGFTVNEIVFILTSVQEIVKIGNITQISIKTALTDAINGYSGFFFFWGGG
jgi:hypothetical protein